jgi:hypothetical protein
VRFWCPALEHEVREEDDETVTIGSPSGAAGRSRPGPVPPVLTFGRVPEGKVVKNRLHLDVNPVDRDQVGEAARLLSLAAGYADVGQGGRRWVALADPEANEFCVLAGRRP